MWYTSLKRETTVLQSRETTSCCGKSSSVSRWTNINNYAVKHTSILFYLIRFSAEVLIKIVKKFLSSVKLREIK